MRCVNNSGEFKNVILISLNLPIDVATTPPTTEMEDPVRYCQHPKVELIIGCDSYGHHVKWGSRDNNVRDKSLCDHIIGNKLCIEARNQRSKFNRYYIEHNGNINIHPAPANI